MQNRLGVSRLMWMAAGVVIGLCIAYFWPHEPVAAGNSDRDSKFGMMTAPVGLDVEGVFVLDYLTGRMTGAVLNTKTGKFSHIYVRSVAADFKVDPKEKPHYAFVGGRAALSGKAGVTPGASVIYVGELTTGMVMAYAMNYRIVRTRIPAPQPFVPLDGFPFREATVK